MYNQPCFTSQCNLGTVAERDLSRPCPKIDTERAKKERGQLAGAESGGGGSFRWPWQPKA